MDDLLQSIRQILAEDFDDRELVRDDGHGPAPENTGNGSRKIPGLPASPGAHVSRGTEPVECAPVHRTPGARGRQSQVRGAGPTPHAAQATDPQPDATSAAVSEIAAAIVANTRTAIAAAQLAAAERSRGPARGHDGEIAPPSPSVDPEMASEERAPGPFTADALREPELGRAEGTRRRHAESLSSLRARLDADTDRRERDRAQRAAASADQAATPAPPVPPASLAAAPLSNVVPLEREDRREAATVHALNPAVVPTPTAVQETQAPSHDDEPACAFRDDELVSNGTRQTVNRSLEHLSRTVLNHNPRTLEDLVRDMMRPLLKEWLEANLPDIVERQVRREVDRVATRGR